MALVSLKEIVEKSIWVAKVGGTRFMGTYDQIKKWRDDPERRDCDVAYWTKQPENLQPFWRDYDEYCEKQRHFITVQEFYPIWVEMRTNSGSGEISPDIQEYLNRFRK